MRLPVGRHSRRESGIVGLLGALILNRLEGGVRALGPRLGAACLPKSRDISYKQGIKLKPFWQ